MQGAQYRNIASPEILQDDAYGIEGRFLVSIQTEGGLKLLDENGKLNAAGRAAVNFWNEISNHFNSVETHEFFVEEESFHGTLTIDVSGKTVGSKRLYYNVVSQYEIAFGLMVGKKNPFQVEGSIFHVISWFKAASMIEIMKDGNQVFKWKSGYFDFSVPKDKVKRSIKDLVLISRD